MFLPNSLKISFFSSTVIQLFLSRKYSSLYLNK
jgi:hypothetical protein